MNTQVRYHQRRLADVAAALRLARTQTNREHGPRAQLAHHQQQRLDTVVRHAATHSPFYRRQLAKTGALGDGPVQLQRLPVLDRSLLMEHFDELVCDPRLRRDQLLDWVGQMARDQLYLDRYRVMLTSGSSGRPGLFVYDAAGWRSIGTQVLRSSSWAGLRPSLPRQRMALLGGSAPSHISRQVAATMAIGLHRVLSLPVTLPLPQLVQALNQFQPTYLHAYPSVAMWLAHEQQAGRLRVAPQTLVTIAELRTPEMTRAAPGSLWRAALQRLRLHRGAVGLRVRTPPRHPPLRGHHPGRERRRRRAAGAAGQPGARLLVTNLYNLVQPLIRLELTDVVTLDPDPCRCGRILVRASTVHGRSDDVLSLPARDGGRVAVHPLHFALLTRDPQVREFQVVQDGPVLHVLVVPGRPTQPSDGSRRRHTGDAALARPSPSNSSRSASRTHKSRSSAAVSSPAQPVASSSS